MTATRIAVAVFILSFETEFGTCDFITTGSLFYTLNANTSTNLGYNKGFKKAELEPYQQRVDLSEL